VPRLRVFAGPNGSGKSTLLEILPPEWVGIYVNADDLERTVRANGFFDLAEFELDQDAQARFARLRHAMQQTERFEDDRALHVAGQLALVGTAIHVPPLAMDSYIAATIADFLRQELLDAGEDFTFETVMSHESKVQFMAEAQQRGYRTYLYFIATDDVAINIDRVQQRVELGGHPVAEANINKRYPKSIALLRAACDAANRAFIFDNSGDAHRLVAEVTNGEELTAHTDSIPAWLAATELWQDFQM
jgi:predicted ABC-type ATPase